MLDAVEAGVRPNRRGARSRELVLDAAERVMAEYGFDGASIARIVEASGVPLSSVYHYYGSKEGVLVAVMRRGAERFFDDLPEFDRRHGSATAHLHTVFARAAATLERHPSFLRLLIVFAVQPPSNGDGEVAAVVRDVRNTALKRLRKQLAIAFGVEARSRAVDQLAHFALATIDGAFVASCADLGITIERLFEPLPDALVAIKRSLQRASASS